MEVWNEVDFNWHFDRISSSSSNRITVFCLYFRSLELQFSTVFHLGSTTTKKHVCDYEFEEHFAVDNVMVDENSNIHKKIEDLCLANYKKTHFRMSSTLSEFYGILMIKRERLGDPGYFTRYPIGLLCFSVNNFSALQIHIKINKRKQFIT